MSESDSVYEKHYAGYLEELSRIDLTHHASILDITFDNDRTATVPFLGSVYRVSLEGIEDDSGRRPDYGTCVILCRYLLMCPDRVPTADDWVHFRDFKESGPLTTYFNENAEGAVARRFSGEIAGLRAVAETLGGTDPGLDLAYDLTFRFRVLPRVPVLLLFNDADDEFPAQCTLLFERRAEQFLDAECLAMVGAYLAGTLTE